MELIVEKINNIESNEIKKNFDLNNLKEDDLNQIDKILKEKIENYTETNDNINYIKSILIDINKEKNKNSKLKKSNLLVKTINNYDKIKIKKLKVLIKENFEKNISINFDKLNDVLEYIFKNNKLNNELLDMWMYVNKKIDNKNTFNKLVNKLDSKINTIFFKEIEEIEKEDLISKLGSLGYFYDESDIFNNLKLKRGYISVFTYINKKYILKYQPNKSYMENIINMYLNKFELSKKYILFPEMVYICKNNSYFYLIEKYDNDLFKFLNTMNNNLDEKEIFKIVYFLIKAIKFIHSKGVIYADIKLENIVLKVDNGKISELKLIDFDVSLFKRLPQNLEEINENVKKLLLNDKTRGTKIYMLKSEKMDYNNDVYSLGVFTIILLYKNIIHIINKERDNLDKNLYVKLKKKLKSLKSKIEEDGGKAELINYLIRILKNRRFIKYWDNKVIHIDFFRKFINNCLNNDKDLEDIYNDFKIKKFY